MSGPRLPQEVKTCKFCYVFSYLFNITEGLGLLNLADAVFILINTDPSNFRLMMDKKI